MLDQIKNRIEEVNKGRQEKTKKKIYKNILSNRLRWAKENDIILRDMEWMILNALGKECKYCGEILLGDNIGLDHKVPINRKGTRDSANVHFICRKCNIRKGELTDREYRHILSSIKSFSPRATKYILSKLSSRTYY